jgi:hypothetical protein|tara:strand:- start:610 stop:1740 length:1131 start_codon:yes stop_codon:yes gene_type:complete
MLGSALDPIIATWVELLAQSIEHQLVDGRGMLAWAVKVAPLINREARELWRAEERAPYLLAFCNFLFESGHRTRYLDALPLRTLAAPPPTQMNELPLRAPALFEMHKERAKLVWKLETSLVRDAADQSSLHPVAGLPLGARCLVGLVEDQHQRYEMHTSYARVFCTCQRVGCTRPALLQPPEVPADESSDAEYWACCRDGRSPAPDACLPSDMSFCSHGCFAAANGEFKRVVSFEIATPACQTRRGGSPTPGRLFRAALGRNGAIERRLLRSTAKTTVHYPSTMADHERLLRDRITMLSVDAGLLYAAMTVVELPARLRPRRQLPCSEDWRTQAACYLGAVGRVRALYLKHGGGRITKTGNEQWLRKVKDAALRIF